MRLGGCIETATCHRVTGKPCKGCFQKISIHDTTRTWRSCIAVGSFLALRGRHAPLRESWISSIISFPTRLGQSLGQVLNVFLWQVYACGMYTPSVVFKLLSGVLQGFWLSCWYVSSSRCRLKRIGAAKALGVFILTVFVEGRCAPKSTTKIIKKHVTPLHAFRIHLHGNFLATHAVLTLFFFGLIGWKRWHLRRVYLSKPENLEV